MAETHGEFKALHRVRWVETATPTGAAAGEHVIQANPSTHTLQLSSNNGTYYDILTARPASIPDAALSANVPLISAPNTYVATQSFAAIQMTGKVTKYNNVTTAGLGLAAILASAARTAQTASIGTTNLLAATPAAGLYKVTWYLHTTFAGTGGTVSLTLGWSDGVAAQSSTTATVPLTTVAAGTFNQATLRFWATSGTAVTYSTTVSGATGSPQYAVYLALEQLA